MTTRIPDEFAPDPLPRPVVEPGEFAFGAAHLDHPHIYGMCQALVDAGATLSWVYDPDPALLDTFLKQFPGTPVARSEAEVLDDPRVRLVAGAAVTSERVAFGVRVMEAGKDYFTDKAPLTTLDQLAEARAAVARTGRKYGVYYSERINVEAAVYAGQLIERGAIGRVLQVIGLGPHRLRPETRPEWFWVKEKYGGILCDIGSHNFEQMLFYTGATDGVVTASSIANYRHPEWPELDDFGDAHLTMDNGTTGYCRVDWFTPDGLSNWGDGRTFILGTDGYLELRKYLNVGTPEGPGHVFLVDGKGEYRFNATGRVGTPFFGQFILDCLNRTELAMTQEHAFKAAELSVIAQSQARVLAP